MMQNLAQSIFAFSYLGLFVVLFAESGFLLGFFLPGDSLIFTAGIFASQGHFNIFLLLIVCVVAAVSGDSFGYWCGKKFGPKIFQRPNSLFFSQKNVEKTKRFYEKYGKKTLVLARFVPVVRTFAPIMAGVSEMPYRLFATYNIIGGVLWAGGITLLGFGLGSVFPETEKYLSYIIILIIFISVLPIARELYVEKIKNRATKN